MNEINPIWRFVLCALALWRVTHLLAEEDGPWDLIVRLRAGLGSGMFGRLMDCFYCLSLWLSLPLAIWLSSGWIGLLVNWQALSGAACLLEKATQKAEQPPPASLAGTEVFEGETSCAVVKSEAQ
ncbi:MAG: hypothetical protein P4L26_00845 [Terracidiphilus sp.]|jgi:hypothetical protein|nr:hypothetical protein [Terracidiphilus sp.]